MTDSDLPALAGDERDLIWLSGLLEGEGAFDAHRGRYPRIRLAMTDRDVVGRAATIMRNGAPRLALHPAPAKPTWHTEVSGVRAAAIMREILPHMGSRRSQAIATALATEVFVSGKVSPLRSSTPGPKIARPAGILRAVA